MNLKKILKIKNSRIKQNSGKLFFVFFLIWNNIHCVQFNCTYTLQCISSCRCFFSLKSNFHIKFMQIKAIFFAEPNALLVLSFGWCGSLSKLSDQSTIENDCSSSSWSSNHSSTCHNICWVVLINHKCHIWNSLTTTTFLEIADYLFFN